MACGDYTVSSVSDARNQMGPSELSIFAKLTPYLMGRTICHRFIAIGACYNMVDVFFMSVSAGGWSYKTKSFSFSLLLPDQRALESRHSIWTKDDSKEAENLQLLYDTFTKTLDVR